MCHIVKHAMLGTLCIVGVAVIFSVVTMTEKDNSLAQCKRVSEDKNLMTMNQGKTEIRTGLSNLKLKKDKDEQSSHDDSDGPPGKGKSTKKKVTTQEVIVEVPEIEVGRAMAAYRAVME